MTRGDRKSGKGIGKRCILLPNARGCQAVTDGGYAIGYHSRAYVEGSVRDLSNLCIEIDKADPAHRDLLQDTIRQRYVKLDTKDVPEYLQGCLSAARKAANE